jgi:hypothetical protein
MTTDPIEQSEPSDEVPKIESSIIPSEAAQLVTQSVAQQEQLVAPLLLQEVPSVMQQEQLATQLVH